MSQKDSKMVTRNEAHGLPTLPQCREKKPKQASSREGHRNCKRPLQRKGALVAGGVSPLCHLCRNHRLSISLQGGFSAVRLYYIFMSRYIIMSLR